MALAPSPEFRDSGVENSNSIFFMQLSTLRLKRLNQESSKSLWPSQEDSALLYRALKLVDWHSPVKIDLGPMLAGKGLCSATLKLMSGLLSPALDEEIEARYYESKYNTSRNGLNRLGGVYLI